MTEQQWGAAPVGGPGAPTPDHPGHTGAPGGVGGVGGSGASSAPGGAGGPGASSGSGPSAGGPGSSGDGRGGVPGGSGGPRASGGPGVSGGPGGPGVPGGPGTSGASGGGPGGGPGGPGGGRGGGSTASGGGRGGGLGGPGGRWSGGTAAGRAWSGRSRSDGPRIERSRQKVVAGVCSGLGRHFGMDPVIFRVPLVVITVIGGLGLLLYGFAWLFLPMEGEEENEARRLLTGRVESTSLGAVLCALAGCGLMVNSLGDSRMMTFALLVTAAVGAAAYWSLNKRGQDPDPTGEPRPEAPPEPMAPPTPAGPSWWREPTTADDYLWGPDGADLGVAGRWTESAAGKEPDTGERCTGGGLSLGTGVFFAALGAGITAATVVWSDQPLGTALVVGLGTALAVFGLGLLVGAFVGRIGGGTIVSVVLTTVLLAGSAALPSDLTTNWSERTWRPAATADVRPDYRVGSGSGTLDLRQLDLAADDTVASTVRVAAGELRVVVPPGAQVEIDLRIGFGGYQLPTSDGTRGGPGAADEQLSGGGLRVRESYSLTPADGDTRRGTIRLKLDLGAGGLVVDRAAQPIEEGR